MKIGASIFFTDYSMAPTDLAVALEQRGFDSLWVAEHSHMPVNRRFTHPLGEAALTKEYFDVMDPFVTLSAAAAVTTRLKLATAICLLIQRIRSKPQSSLPPSTVRRKAVFCLASAAAGMPRKWKTTAPSTKRGP
jgi:hypothetical protein